MHIDQDLGKIAEQELALELPQLDEDIAWQLGTALREAALRRDAAVVIDIRRGERILFFHAMRGTSPANADWARRKRNAVEMMHQSSYALGLEQERDAKSILEKMGLPLRDFSCHGGCFPIRVSGAGFVGTVTVSGMPQREDHALVVEVLAQHLGKDHSRLALDSE
jgi:uncharacterized protein (UPF0303 family)